MNRRRTLLILALTAALPLTVAVGILYLATQGDPVYGVLEALNSAKYHRYDEDIVAASRSYGVPPELIKAVVWRESRFDPDKAGAHGERGLMQVTEIAARDWAKAERVTTFAPQDLFDPKTNIEVGTWYLSQALMHWSAKDDPAPFALAEYNAGRTRVNRWLRDSGLGANAGAGDLQQAMDFPYTKSYISAIVGRADYYKRRGEFPAAPQN